MNSNNKETKKTNNNEPIEEQPIEKEYESLFPSMDIKEDFSDPSDNIFNEFSKMNNMFFGNFFPEIKFLNEKKHSENKTNEINNNKINNNGSTIISKVYCSKYENKNGEPHQECYESNSIEQTDKEGHDISEKNELYKNSNGIQKASKQCMLDKKGTKIIRQRNVKNGEHNEKKLYKGLEEKDFDGFNKEYNQYKEKIGFKKNYKFLNEMNSYFNRGNNLLSNESGNKKALSKRN